MNSETYSVEIWKRGKLVGHTSFDMPDDQSPGKSLEYEGYVYRLRFRLAMSPSAFLFWIDLDKPVRKAGEYHVYAVYQDGVCKYVGATKDLRARRSIHNNRWPGLMMVILHTGTAEEIKHLETQEIAIHAEKYPWLKNATPTSNFTDWDPPMKSIDPMFQ